MYLNMHLQFIFIIFFLGIMTKYDSYFQFGDGTVFLDNLHCSSTISSLTNCSHGPVTCDPVMDIAGVICSGSVGTI